MKCTLKVLFTTDIVSWDLEATRKYICIFPPTPHPLRWGDSSNLNHLQMCVWQAMTKCVLYGILICIGIANRPTSKTQMWITAFWNGRSCWLVRNSEGAFRVMGVSPASGPWNQRTACPADILAERNIWQHRFNNCETRSALFKELEEGWGN